MGAFIDAVCRRNKADVSSISRAGSFAVVCLFLSGAANTGAQTPISQLDAPGMNIFLSSGGRVAWSWKLNIIAFDKLGANGYYDVYTANPDGSNQHCLTCNQPALPNRHKGLPDFDFSGTWIVFQAEKPDAPQGSFEDSLAQPGSGLWNDVWVMDVQGAHFYQLTDIPLQNGGVLHAHFSHKGDKLQWAQRLLPTPLLLGTWEINVADFVVTNGVPGLQNIRNYQPGQVPRFYETHGFSQDDQSVYFSGDPDLNQSTFGDDIYVFNLQTGGLINLTNTPDTWDEHAALSPDGTKLLWMSGTGAGSTAAEYKTDYWIMNVDGSNQRRLTWFNGIGFPESSSTPVACSRVAWSPDGKRFLGYLVTDNIGEAGPDVMIDLVAPTSNLSSASFRPLPLAPGSIVSIFSRNMSAQPLSASEQPLPNTLGTTTVQVTDSAGKTVGAPLFYVSGGQVNYAVPSGLAMGAGNVSVYRGGFLVAQGGVQVADIAPGLFTANSSGQGVAAAFYVQANAGGGQTTHLVFNCPNGVGSCVPVPIDLGPATVETVLVLYGTGVRGDSSAVSATIGGVPAQVQFVGAQCCFVGVDQLNVLVPHTLAGKGQVDVVVTVDGQKSNVVQVSFQ